MPGTSAALAASQLRTQFNQLHQAVTEFERLPLLDQARGARAMLSLQLTFLGHLVDAINDIQRRAT